MATQAQPQVMIDREARFFLIMAFVMAGSLVTGFSLDLVLGRASFGLPLLFHIHAFIFFGWVALYVTQNALVATGNMAIHRRLGWLAALFVPAMVVLGIALTLFSVRNHGGPPFFDVNEFLVGNVLTILSFAGVVAMAIAMRRRTDWHRRMMFCAMALVTGPGFGRLLPMPFLIPWAWWVAFLAPLLFLFVGAAFDAQRTGRVHPAWWLGIGLVAGALLATDVIAYSPAGYAVTHAVIDGTPGAARSMKAFLPTG